jgi:O-antigen ligase
VRVRDLLRLTRAPFAPTAAWDVLAATALAPWPVSLVTVPLMLVLAAGHTRVALGAVAAAAPFYYGLAMHVGPQAVGPVELLIALAVAGRLAAAYVSAERVDWHSLPGALHPLDWLVLLIVAWAALTPLWAEFVPPAVREWRVVLLEPALFYFLLRSHPRRSSAAMAAMDGLVIGAVGASIWALGGVALHQLGIVDAAVAAEGVVRARGPYGSPNNLALFLGRLVPVVVAFGVWGTGRRRRLYAAAGALIAIALLATFSRSALVVGLPVSGLYLIAVALWKNRRLGGRAIAAVAGAAALVVLAIAPFAGSTRVRGTFDVSPGSTVFIRLRLWESAWQMVRDHPFLGVGLDNFLYLYRDRYVQRAVAQERFLSHPHNAILDWWTRLGLPGLVAFAALVAGNVVVGVSVIRAAGTASLALAVAALGMQVYALAHGMVDNVFFLVDLALMWWIAQAALLALSQVED